MVMDGNLIRFMVKVKPTTVISSFLLFAVHQFGLIDGQIMAFIILINNKGYID